MNQHRKGGSALLQMTLLLAHFLILPWAHAADKDGFWIKDAKVKLVEGIYYLDANIDFDFDAANIEAIKHGVPVTVEVQIKVLRSRNYLWGEEIAHLNQEYQVRYHALSERFLVLNFNSGQQLSFHTWEEAMTALGTLTAIPVLDKSLLTSNDKYQVRIRAILDVEALPIPLRPLAYLSPLWSMANGWYSCPLE